MWTRVSTWVLAALLLGSPARADDAGAARAPAPDAEAGRARVYGASVAPPGEWRAGMSLGYFSSEAFPKPGVAHAQSAGRLALAAGVTGELEAFAQVGLVANRNEGTVPRLIQAVGDVTLGAKWVRAFDDVLRGGAVLALQLPAGTGSVSLAPEALGASFAALGGARVLLGEGADAWDLRLSAQVGAQIDRSEALLPSGADVPIVAEYGLGVSRYTRFQGGLSASFGTDRIAGYAEFHVDAPIGVPDDALRLATSGERVRYPTVVAWRLTPGLRWVPVRGMTIDAGWELGFGNSVVRGFASAPPWALRVGATFAFDPVRASSESPPPAPPEPPPPPLVVDLPPPPPPPPELPTTGWIEGRVTLADGEPIEGAIVTFAGDRGPPVATDQKGRFRTYPLPPGSVGLIARKQGYSPGTASVEISRGQAVGASLLLEPRQPPAPTATLAARLCDAGAPLAGRIRLRGPATRTIDVDPSGLAKVGELPTGTYTLVAEAPGRLARARTLELEAEAIVPVEICLEPAPAKVPWDGTGSPLVVKGLAFAKDGTLASAASPALDALADVLLRRDQLAFARVEAHVDPGAGKPPALAVLTTTQAQAIAGALAARGIRVSIDAVGKGAAEPAVKGKGAAAKAANTRVVVSFGP